MRTTMDLDDGLVKLAREMTGIQKKTQLVEEALRGMIRREAARRLAASGGSMPGARHTRRRRLQ
jgi:Arc/MetJ family transcription regulator